ncbi:hypothetical protein SAMN05446935_7642 [Burkholderia sp. YR290]|nr:hypothetical protein SAMN05446935_7642 [Burkholderia sp. YR290]
MSGDYSRRRFDKRLDFSTVLSQQGRVQLDSDWNELSEIHSRRLRSETVGIIGRAVVPSEETRNQSAFEITPVNGTLMIGPGRMYVDGLLVENHGMGKVEFDPVLEEDRATQPIPYENQPYFPNAKDVAPLPKEKPDGPYAVYLDVWQREVGYLEQSVLVESAVGVDTTTRLQTAWQVRLLPGIVDNSTTCDTDLPLELTQASDARLSTMAVGVSTSTDPCLIPPSGGYRGLDNRMYRLEIHDGGTAGTASFKWSRDNASLATAVTAISSDGKTLTVATVARDSVLRFAVGDWIEITDDLREFAFLPGIMANIEGIVSETLTIELDIALQSGVFPAGSLDPARHTRVRRWDQRGKVLDTNGNLLVDLDLAPHLGVIPVPQQGISIVLEDGVQVTFDTSKSGEYHVADYWNFVARTADASVEPLDQAAPRGVHHHFCRLAIVSLTPKTAPVDCRTFWPPAFGAADCECTACVSVEQFNNDKNRIRTAINGLLKTGGKLCLGPGVFALEETVELNSQKENVSIHVSGRGQSTVLIQPKTGPAFSLTGAGITVEDLTVWMRPSPATAGALSRPAFAVSNVLDFALQRCEVVPLSPSLLTDADVAIQLSGFVLNATIRDNLLQAGRGISSETAKRGTVVATLNLEILNNDIIAGSVGSSVGIALSAFATSNTRLSGNTISVTSLADTVVGLQLFTIGAPSSRLEIDSNYVVVASAAPAGTFGAAHGIGLGNTSQFPTFGSVIRVANNDIFVSGGSRDPQSKIGGGATGIEVDLLGFEHLLFEGNSVHGSPGKNPVGWVGLVVRQPAEVQTLGRCEIKSNLFEATPTAAYRAVQVQITGDCAFVDNQCVNNSPQGQDTPSDVDITAATIVTSNNRVKGQGGALGPHNSMQLSPSPVSPEAVTVLGNVCSGQIRLGSVSLSGTRWDPFNITV